jgi:methylase of polypeptide subunit release factors
MAPPPPPEREATVEKMIPALSPRAIDAELRERALIALGRELRARGYEFVTVTPATHARAKTGDRRLASSLRDVFGWSHAFTKEALPAELFDLLEEAGALVESNGVFQSTLRVSSLGGELFFHSVYPTTHADAVFFGPDTYRFCAAIARVRHQAKRVVDVGCGSGAGGIVAGRTAERVVLADVNEKALTCARVNAALAGMANVEILRSDVLDQVGGDIDLVIANPPYMRDDLGRTYRDGGGDHGEGLSLRILKDSLERLVPGGRLLLYTGAAVVDGQDVFLRAARPLLSRSGATFDYEEIDPDVFGEELDKPGYAAVERIAAVVLTATRPTSNRAPR